jgi:hypothetical protein
MVLRKRILRMKWTLEPWHSDRLRYLFPEMAKLSELLSSPKIRSLNDEYDRNWGAVDFSTKLIVTIS